MLLVQNGWSKIGVLQARTNAFKEADPKELPQHFLANMFRIEDVHERRQDVIDVVFAVYYRQLDAQIPEWVRQHTAEIDTEGMATEAILDALTANTEYASFEEVDRKIRTSFAWLLHEAAVGAWKTRHNFNRTISLDTPLPSDKRNGSTRNDIIPDRHALSPLDLLVIAEESVDEKAQRRKQDVKERERQKKKEAIVEAAKAVLGPKHLEVFNLRFREGAAYGDIAENATFLVSRLHQSSGKF
jgi:hypothetical protein